MQVDAPKAADHNSSQQITRRSRGMRAGLKILVSAVQARPSPPFFSATCPLGNFSRTDFVPRFVPNSGTLQRIPAHEAYSEGRLGPGARVSAVLRVMFMRQGCPGSATSG